MSHSAVMRKLGIALIALGILPGPLLTVYSMATAVNQSQADPALRVLPLAVSIETALALSAVGLPVAIAGAGLWMHSAVRTRHARRAGLAPGGAR